MTTLCQSARGPTLRCRPEILRPQFDRRTMGRAVGGMVPGVAVAMLGFEGCDTLRRDQFLECREPMAVIGLAIVGVTARLRALDFIGKRCGPLVPGEQAALMQRERHRKGLRFPGFAEYRPFIVAGDIRQGVGCTHRGSVVHAGSRYGSNASMDIFTVGSASGPHSSVPSNTTV